MAILKAWPIPTRIYENILDIYTFDYLFIFKHKSHIKYKQIAAILYALPLLKK